MFICSSYISSAQYKKYAPYAVAYGNVGYSAGYSICKTYDTAYVLVGSTNMYTSGNTDMYIFKVDSTAKKMLWQQRIGGLNNDVAQSVVQTKDSGFMVVGYTNSYGAGGYDGYVVKLNKNGQVLWRKSFGGSEWDFISNITKTNDGNFICCGYTYSMGSGNADVWVAKMNPDGLLLWQKTIGGANDDIGKQVIEKQDHSLLIVGTTASFGNGKKDGYLINLKANGDTLWTKTYGGVKDDELNTVCELASGKLYIGGYNASVSINGNKNYYILNIDINGNVLWQELSNGNNNDELVRIKEDSFGNYVFAINTENFGFGSSGVPDIGMYRFHNGNFFLSGATFGNQYSDVAADMIYDNDSCFLVVGTTESFAANAFQSVYLIKYNIGRSGVQTANIIQGIKEPRANINVVDVYPNPFVDELVISLPNAENISVELQNALGEIVTIPVSIDNTSIKLTTTTLNAGVYFLHVIDKNVVDKTIKVVKY